MDDMKLTPKERAVLAGVLRDRDHLARLDWNLAGVARAQLGAYRVRIARRPRRLRLDEPGREER